MLWDNPMAVPVDSLSDGWRADGFFGSHEVVPPGGDPPPQSARLGRASVDPLRVSERPLRKFRNSWSPQAR